MHLYELILENGDSAESLGQFESALDARDRAQQGVDEPLGWTFPYRTNNCAAKSPNGGKFFVKKIA